MSASSAAASSTLSRSRITIAAVTAVITAFTVYHFYRGRDYDAQLASLPGSGLHRSNAVHRRRRRNTTSTADTAIFVDDGTENETEEQIIARALTDGETVIDGEGAQEEYAWTNAPQSYDRAGQNIVQLLFRVSEDATRRNSYVHRGCACNSCGVVPIRGTRYRCANCADYDLCETCEAQGGLHTKTHIFYKIKVPAPSFSPRHIQPVWYSGDPDSVMRILPKEVLTKLSRETGFERTELDAYWEQWTFMANTDWRDDPDDINLAMDRKTFERCLVPSGGYRQSAPSLIFDRMFAFYDSNKDDLIGFSEFLHGIAYRKKKDKWGKIFEGYDIDGDGFVDRKDFLRMFRSYYVLYRQMHRDMLEGMDEQQMSTTEAHRLINGRQPLSSAFGQDGIYPRAPDLRAGEGKIMRPNGEQEVVDGKGVMTESGNDTGNREDVFRRDLPPPRRNSYYTDNNTGFWETMLNPPETVEQLPDVIESLRRNEVRDRFVFRDEADPTIQGAREDENEETDSDSDDALSNPDASRNWPPAFVTVTDHDAEAIQGAGTRVADVLRSNRRAVISHAIYREKAERDLHERWQRRQFYTDEEDGAVPPANWNDDDDCLVHAGIAGESSIPTRPVIHSRSSSKVRFVENMDDFYETQSNHSTSSRSVPERWGGMEIPDAEKDAGKEILYQVTQQAFNELLDALFKKKEDLAVMAAETKAAREKHRNLFTHPEFEEWAKEREAKAIEKEEIDEHTVGNSQPSQRWPHFPETELEEVRERPLEELLAATGYEIQEHMPELEAPDASESDSAEPVPIIEETSSHDTDSRPRAPPPTSPTEVLSIIAQYDDDRGPPTPHSTPPQATPSTSGSDSSRRDPTLPQFRPNSVDAFDPTFPQFRPDSDYSFNPADHPRQTDFLPLTKEEQELRSSFSPDSEDESAPVKQKSPMSKRKERTPTKEKLYLYWKADKAAKEAEERGGWGRLNFEEFEKLVKRAAKERGDNGMQMGYLGSWIEFCIP